jgi:hypothetical protein
MPSRSVDLSRSYSRAGRRLPESVRTQSAPMVYFDRRWRTVTSRRLMSAFDAVDGSSTGT